MQVASERGSLTGEPFGALPTPSAGRSQRQMTLVIVPPPPDAPPLRIEVFPKPRAVPAPRTRALAVVAALTVTCGAIATLVAIALR